MAYTSADESEEGIGCLTWHSDLVDIRTFSDEGQDLYIREDSIVLGNTLSNTCQCLFNYFYHINFLCA